MNPPLKSFCIISLIIFSTKNISAQGNEWTWMKGDSTVNKASVYGTKGIASAANNPGARHSSVSWTDLAGNFWLFGGYVNYSTFYSDLWKYDFATNEWTWMNGDSIANVSGSFGTQGVAGAANCPGARYGSAGWTDASGNFWLFAGSNSGGAGLFNDLWKYNVAINQWTWMKGDSTTGPYAVFGAKGIASPSNNPGAMRFCMNWKDGSGNLWIYGGLGKAVPGAAGHLNDLWKYNMATNQWTWVNGDTLHNVRSVYGAKGIASAGNQPGARAFGGSWTDASGNFWMYGGEAWIPDHGVFTAAIPVNDLWKYDLSSNHWTWVNGDSSGFMTPHYGINGTPSQANTPGARDWFKTWTDHAGHLWLFGGWTYKSSGANPLYNFSDLWKYDIASGAWTWAKGDSAANTPAVYGTKGISAPANHPGARQRPAASWLSQDGNLWVFGGSAAAVINPTSTAINRNDLWRYVMDTSATVPVHLLAFTAKLKADKVTLHWTVENEQAFHGYEAERSANGSTFHKTGFIPANNLREYALTDKEPIRENEHTLYYRLKLVDKSGRFTYSNIRTVTTRLLQTRLSLFPNPATKEVQLQFSKALTGKIQIEITDAAGKVILKTTREIHGTSIILSLTGMSAGNYAIKATSGDYKSISKLMKLE